MYLLRKIDLADIDLFKCPVCSDSMELKENKSLVCFKGHCFDLSKNGYVNLLLRPAKTEYNKEMLNSRNIILTNGFFKPLAEQISEIAADEIGDSSLNQWLVLDAGCGEGTFLEQTVTCIQKHASCNVIGVGIDISKEGIQIAAKKYRDQIWCVGDLSNCPFMANKFNVLLNILSPSNYGEFRRILKDEGMLIKVVPGSNYLQELREVFYDQTEKETYSNEKVIHHFEENFNVNGIEQLQYTIDIHKENLKHLIRMTPLSWSASKERIEKALNIGIDSITVDLTVMYGRNKSR